MGEQSDPAYKCFVGGLTWDLTNEQLQDGESGTACCWGVQLCKPTLPWRVKAPV
jgi:hypothetical protein